MEEAASELRPSKMGLGLGLKTEEEIRKMVREIKPCPAETGGEMMVSLCVSTGL